MALSEEERLFMLSMVKLVKPKTEFDKRALKRVTMRLMGIPVQNYPLHPPKECPVCEREFAYHHYERHAVLCKLKDKNESKLPPIDKEVYERLRYYGV